MSENLPPNPDGNNPPPIGNEPKGIEPKPNASESSLLNEKVEPKEPPKPDGEKKDPPKAEGAPEKYEAFKLPDEFEANEAVMTEAQGIFKELNLPQAAAQKLVDFYAKVSQNAADAPFNLWKDTQQKWKDEIKADPEIGGKLDSVRATVSKAIDSLGPTLSKPFREAMDFTGAGNNPAFIRAFYALAQKVVEGGHVEGKPPGGAKPSAAQALYPNLKSSG